MGVDTQLERGGWWDLQPPQFVAMEKELDGFNTAVRMSPPRRAMTSWTGSSE